MNSTDNILFSISPKRNQIFLKAGKFTIRSGDICSSIPRRDDVNKFHGEEEDSSDKLFFFLALFIMYKGRKVSLA